MSEARLGGRGELGAQAGENCVDTGRESRMSAHICAGPSALPRLLPAPCFVSCRPWEREAPGPKVEGPKTKLLPLSRRGVACARRVFFHALQISEGPWNYVSKHTKNVAEMSLEFWPVTEILRKKKKKFKKENINIFGQKDR